LQQREREDLKIVGVGIGPVLTEDFVAGPEEFTVAG
jgi:hypothetical protein